MDGLYKFIVMPEYKEVFAAKVSTKQHTITEDGFYYNEEGFLYKYTGEETDVVIRKE